MNQPIIILGAGGHARVLLEVLRLRGRQVLGLSALETELFNTLRFGYRVLGDNQIVFNYAKEEVRLVNAVGSVDSMHTRKQLFDYFKQAGYQFEQVIHPSAIIAQDSVLGEGAQIMAGAVIQPGAQIGDNTIINTRASIDHDCNIGRHVHIAPGVTLSGTVTVEDETHIGTGATVIQGIRIGNSSLVAAGAVVNKNIAGGKTVMGVPAREVGSVE